MAETPAPPQTECLVIGRPELTLAAGLIVKRTLRIGPQGTCHLDDEQLPIDQGLGVYDDSVESPLSSPPTWDNDLLAFKMATDVVVQGHAYSSGATSVDAEVRVGNVSRVVRVFGDRHCDWSGGRPRLSDPLPFDKLPLRYDRAYGGYDPRAHDREGDNVTPVFAEKEPGWELERNTRFHYPRNRSGVGFLVQADQEAVESLAVPNLEFPFDPLSVERMTVGSTSGWLSAPMPAGFDWYDPTWFPRFAYLGFVQEHDPNPPPVPEVSQGWAPPDILSQLPPRDLGWHPGFLQGASPGLAIPGLPADAELVLRHVFPEQAERRIRLPGWTPRVTIALTPRDQQHARTHLNAVVVRPDENRVVLVWCARIEVTREYTPEQLAEARWSVA